MATTLTKTGEALILKASHTGAAPLSTSHNSVTTPHLKPHRRATLVAPVLRLPLSLGSRPQNVLATTSPHGTEPST